MSRQLVSFTLPKEQIEKIENFISQQPYGASKSRFVEGCIDFYFNNYREKEQKINYFKRAEEHLERVLIKK